MLFLVYSPFSGSNIRDNLGLADYSYYFVMERFLPLLREFGEVEILEQPPCDEDVALRQQSGPCIYLSFTPPGKVAAITRCPAIPVFAWEYSTIPDEEFTCPQDNWARVLRESGRAITHSRYALDVVKAQLGEGYPIESIPAPIWDSYQGIREQRTSSPPRGLAGLNLDCTIIDSNDYQISNTSIRPRQDSAAANKRILSEQWGGEPLVYDFTGAEADLTLIGFNEAEPWGVWSRSGYPWVLFDCAIEGEIELSITVRGYMHNIGKRLRVEVGSVGADLLLSEKLQTHVFRMTIEHPTNVLSFDGLVERAVGAPDPRDIGMGLSRIEIRRPVAPAQETDSLDIDLSQDEVVSEGLYDREVLGRWTFAPAVSIQLPTPLAGDFTLTVEVFHIQHNHGCEVDICLGEQRQTVTLEDGRNFYELEFSGVTTTDYVSFNGLGFGPSGNEHDPRVLGLGLKGISLQRREPDGRERSAMAGLKSLDVWSAAGNFFKRLRSPRNILYTAIFNPKDGRKNWEDIITGFVYAFRDDPGATLLIKITYHDLGELYEDIFTYLIELHPFKCRLIFIHGYLSGEQYEQLLLHSHFIVNASRGEGQCLPLMEFMSSGVPAVAPDNTAMGEYINESNAFIVKSSPDITFWPHDPRQVLRTMWQRIDWGSLVTAYSESATVYRSKRGKYRAMSNAAVESQQRYCSMENARTRFRAVLDGLEREDGR